MLREAALLLLVFDEPGSGPRECIYLHLPGSEPLLLIICNVGSSSKAKGSQPPVTSVPGLFYLLLVSAGAITHVAYCNITQITLMHIRVKINL